MEMGTVEKEKQRQMCEKQRRQHGIRIHTCIFYIFLQATKRQKRQKLPKKQKLETKTEFFSLFLNEKNSTLTKNVLIIMH